ncbi:MAG: IPExxxVDY family protein [Flavobacteriaceae bacterium]|nr:IPExxxVDY family protein [Flavobacteriaceae bacterium]
MSVLFFEDEIDFSLIGIYSVEKAYRLAFLLNKWTRTYLVKSKEKYLFEMFEYEDELHFRSFYLIKNKFFLEKKMSVGLFEEKIIETNYLIPEKKEIDYFIKIHDCESFFLTKFLEQIKSIEEVQMAHIIDAENLKSKQNLIF